MPRKSMVNTAELRQIFPLRKNTLRHVVEGDGRYPRAMTPRGQEPCTQPCNTTNTNNSSFNDTSRYEGCKNRIQQVLLGLLFSFPVNYTCYQYTVVGKYCALCVLPVGWCQLALGTMENTFVNFLLWSGHCIQLALTSTTMIQIYILWARLMAFTNMK